MCDHNFFITSGHKIVIRLFRKSGPRVDCCTPVSEVAGRR